MKYFKEWLTPPAFEDEIRTEQAYLLHIILWALICVPIPYVIFTLVATPENSGRAFMQAAFGETVNVILLIMLRRGYVRAAAIIQVSTFWLFFTATAATGAGVQGEAYLLGYGLVITIAGMFLGWNGAFTFTLLSLASGGLMVYGETRGIVDSGFASSTLTTWIISLALFPIGALLQHLASRTIRNSLRRARASEQRYRLISQVSSDYTFSTELDPSGNMRLNWVAGALEKITGYTFDDYVANGGWLAHLHPDDLEKDARALERLRANQEVVHDIRTFKKRGELRWVRVYAHPVWDGNQDRLVGIVGAVQDIHEQKKAEEREANWRLMLEQVVRLGKLVTEVADLRTTLERIWHGVHDELKFDRLAIFLYDQESHSVKGTFGTNNSGEIVEEWDYSQSLQQGQPTSFTRALDQPDGVYFTRNFTTEFNIPEGHEMYAVEDFAAVTAWGGNKPVAIITVDNFPSQRAIEKEQLEALRLFAGYAGLAIENARLNSTLENDLNHRKSLIKELETKNAELERFTYTVSHDLKSPLVTITGFLGFLEQDALAGESEKVSANIRRINNAANRMQDLLNDLLELSRVGRLMNPPEDVPFTEIVYEAVDRVRGRLDEINAIVEIQTNMPIVHGDRIRLVEVVQNLVENAVKYSNHLARTRIEIGRAEDTQQQSVFFVRDNGIGIAHEYHEKIFGLFNKLDARAEGTGIGLTLVKRIIEVHGGRIWVESEVGEGTTFRFTLHEKETKEK